MEYFEVEIRQWEKKMKTLEQQRKYLKIDLRELSPI
jgi:hypothetical protein